MTLFAAFKVLLSRWSGSTDIVVGTPVAGRRRTETEGMIGLFRNTLVLRTDLGGDPSFTELLDRVRKVALGAYDHQDIPFEVLLDDLAPQHDLSRTPLFQIFFNLLNLPVEPFRLDGLEVEVQAAPERFSKFDLAVYLERQDEGLRVHLIYSTDLFAAARIAELASQYDTLLGLLVDDPGRHVMRA